MLRREHRTRRHGLRSAGGWLPACAGWLAALSFLTVSCINEYPVDEPPGASVGSGLALRVSLLDAEGYDEDAEGGDLPRVERMHDLRVIITHRNEDGKEVLEYNRHIDFDDPEYAGKYRYGYLDNANLLFKVPEGSPMKKHLYLFSNSEPVFEAMFAAEGSEVRSHPDPEEGVYGGNHYVDVSQGDVDKYLYALRNVTFTQGDLDGFLKPEADGKVNGIPMSAEYDVEVEPGNTGVSGLCVIGDLYLVRACNKITFTYTNDRMNGDIFINGWTLNPVATRSYLLPHVTDNDVNQKLFGPYTDYDGNWIKWYMAHILGKEGHVEELDFEVPANPEYSSYPHTYSQTNTATHGTDINEKVTGLCAPQRSPGSDELKPVHDEETYYFLESRYTPSAINRQEYAMSFSTKEYNSTTDEWGSHWWLTNYPSSGGSYQLTNVTTLFRNTHVEIHAILGDKDQVALDVTLKSWEVNQPVEGHFD